MRSNVLIAGMTALLCACTPHGVEPVLPHVAGRIEVLEISPAAGAALTSNSTIVAEVKFAIDDFQPGTDYYIAPVFAATDRDGATFNAGVIGDFPKAAAASGSLTIRYGVARELRHPDLRRPVTLWFFLMERTGPHQTRVIAMTEPIKYSD